MENALDHKLMEGLASGTPAHVHLPQQGHTAQQARIFWVTLEGIIGAGKTELCKVLTPCLEEHFGKNRVFFVAEPIDELMSSGLFQAYQRAPQRWAFEFQTTFFHKRTMYFRAAYDAMLKTLASTWETQDRYANTDLHGDERPCTIKTAIMLSERSIVSDTCFMRVQYECGHVDQDSLDRYLDLNAMWRELYHGMVPGLIVYCRAGADQRAVIGLCQQRIRERKRESEEDLVTPEYNTIVLREHDRLFAGPASVFVADGFAGLAPVAVPIVVVDTTENYRDDKRVALKKSSELLAQIQASLNPPSPPPPASLLLSAWKPDPPSIWGTVGVRGE
jgi:deoxyadenosine/deoxycytidine kinase